MGEYVMRERWVFSDCTASVWRGGGEKQEMGLVSLCFHKHFTDSQQPLKSIEAYSRSLLFCSFHQVRINYRPAVTRCCSTDWRVKITHTKKIVSPQHPWCFYIDPACYLCEYQNDSVWCHFGVLKYQDDKLSCHSHTEDTGCLFQPVD